MKHTILHIARSNSWRSIYNVLRFFQFSFNDFLACSNPINCNRATCFKILKRKCLISCAKNSLNLKIYTSYLVMLSEKHDSKLKFCFLSITFFAHIAVFLYAVINFVNSQLDTRYAEINLNLFFASVSLYLWVSRVFKTSLFQCID